MTNKNAQVIVIILVLVLISIICCPHFVKSTVTELGWVSTVEVEQYSQVHVRDSHAHPPVDAYNRSSDRHCITTYHKVGKTDVPTTTCHDEYSYTVDRWVVVNKVRNSGTDRSPTYLPTTLIHVETGYGNQRQGRSYTTYYLIGSNQKRCEISLTSWQKVTVGSPIQMLKFGVLGHWCYIKYK